MTLRPFLIKAFFTTLACALVLSCSFSSPALAEEKKAKKVDLKKLFPETKIKNDSKELDDTGFSKLNQPSKDKGVTVKVGCTDEAGRVLDETDPNFSACMTKSQQRNVAPEVKY